MQPSLETIVKYNIQNHSLHDQPLDATWTGDGEFLVCGGDILQEFLCVENAITPGRKFEVAPGEVLSKITYDPRSHLLATASESGTISVRFLLLGNDSITELILNRSGINLDIADLSMLTKA